MSLTGRSLRQMFAENQILMILLAIMAGILFPTALHHLNAIATPLLILVFFTSSLRLTLKEIITYGRDWRMLLIVNLYMLVILPLALYLPAVFFDRTWAIAFLIVGSVPAGMTIALIADYFGGKTALALVMTATSSLLAPFTLPLLFKITLGQEINIPVFHMFWSLFLTIVIPCFFALLVKRAVPEWIEKRESWFREISLIAFSLLIAGIVADSARDHSTLLALHDLPFLLLMLTWFGALVWGSYYVVRWRLPSERITIALCVLYLNNTLALFIGDKFFRSFNVVPKILFLLLVINIFLPPLRIAAKRVTHYTIAQ